MSEMQPPTLEVTTLARTTAMVTRVGLGCSPIGDLYTSMSEDAAQAVLSTAWDAGIRYFDTAPFYGHGKSEHRLGHFLRQQPRDQFTISTKVGRVLRAAPGEVESAEWSQPLPFELRFDYTYDGVMRSFEDSLQRLGLARVDVLLIHDLDFGYFKTERRVNAHLSDLATGGWRALEELRAAQVIKGVGAGINERAMIPRLLDVTDVDLFLVAGDYTLLDTGILDVEFPLCASRDVGVVVGAAFASGILATGPVPGARYRYAEPPAEIIEKTERIAEVCGRHGTPLAAAALQFPLAHPLVSAIIPGAGTVQQVTQNVELLEKRIDPGLWGELKAEGLLPAAAPTPH